MPERRHDRTVGISYVIALAVDLKKLQSIPTSTCYKAGSKCAYKLHNDTSKSKDLRTSWRSTQIKPPRKPNAMKRTLMLTGIALAALTVLPLQAVATPITATIDLDTVFTRSEERR